jgi:hypothetical protein
VEEGDIVSDCKETGRTRVICKVGIIDYSVSVNVEEVGTCGESDRRRRR